MPPIIGPSLSAAIFWALLSASLTAARTRSSSNLDALHLGLGRAHADVRDGDGDGAAARRGLDGLAGEVFLHLLDAHLQLAHHLVVHHGWVCRPPSG
jgi:hypothetical protein